MPRPATFAALLIPLMTLVGCSSSQENAAVPATVTVTTTEWKKEVRESVSHEAASFFECQSIPESPVRVNDLVVEDFSPGHPVGAQHVTFRFDGELPRTGDVTFRVETREVVHDISFHDGEQSGTFFELRDTNFNQPIAYLKEGERKEDPRGTTHQFPEEGNFDFSIPAIFRQDTLIFIPSKGSLEINGEIVSTCEDPDW